MEIICHFDEIMLPDGTSRPGKRLLEGIKGAKAGIMLCDDVEYGDLGDHDDQEGFYIIAGTGFALIDGKEYRVAKDTVILLQAHMLHTFKRDSDSVPLKIFWFHAAA